MTDRRRYVDQRGMTDEELVAMSSNRREPGAWFTYDQAAFLVLFTIIVGSVGMGALARELAMVGVNGLVETARGVFTTFIDSIRQIPSLPQGMLGIAKNLI